MHPMSKKEKKPEDVTPEEQTEQAVPTEETEAEAPNPLLEELEALKKSLSDQEDKFLRLAAEYDNYAYTCTSDGKWEGSDTDAIQSQPFWTTKETSFPIPEGGGPSSTTDPQQTVSQAYNTVLLPMDDGNWHVTVYCPAALDASLLDKDANELDPDQVKAGDEAYTVISATGYGTVQHPCRTVEVVVGGQKPFWSLRNTQ